MLVGSKVYDWYAKTDIVKAESMTMFIPSKRWCNRCGKIGDTSDIDFTKLEENLPTS